jgi:hypothetical protein
MMFIKAGYQSPLLKLLTSFMFNNEVAYLPDPTLQLNTDISIKSPCLLHPVFGPPLTPLTSLFVVSVQ